MDSAESWDLTPREFEARRKVREVYMALWRSELRNAPHFRREDKKPWTSEHFLQPQKQVAKDLDLQAEVMRGKFQAAQMTAGTFDEAQLPEWARMTPEEKKRRPN